MPQTLLQQITTSWNWIRGFRIGPIRLQGGYNFNIIKPYLSDTSYKLLSEAEHSLAKLRISIGYDLRVAKSTIRKLQAEENTSK